MREEVRRRLRDRGVPIADSVFGGATRIVDEQLGYEIARYTFGPAAERRRRAADDRQIQRGDRAGARHDLAAGAAGLSGQAAPQAH